MATDPRLAAEAGAAAAAQARAAAQAAAELLAAEAAAATASAAAAFQAEAAEAAAADARTSDPAAPTKAGSLESATPTIDDSVRKVLADTGVTLGSVVAEDIAMVNELPTDGSNMAGSGRESLMSLPGLSSIGSIGGTGLTSGLPDLGTSFQSNSGPTFGTSMISDGAGSRVHMGTTVQEGGHLIRTDGYSNGSITDNRSWKVTYDYDTNTGILTVTTRDDDTGDTDSKSYNTGSDGVTPLESRSDEGDPVWSSGVDAAEVTAWFDGLFGGGDDGSSGDSASSSGSSGGTTGGGVGDVPAEDAQFTPPPGWINPEDLDFIPGERKTGGLVAGAMGGNPDDDDDTSTTPGPSGGDNVINPGEQGTMYEVGRQTDLRDAKAWYGGVGQPGDPDLEMIGGGNPQVLAEGMPSGPAPETINPGDGTQANSDAQKSTAYSTAYSDAATDAAADGTEAATSTDMPAEDDGGSDPSASGLVEEAATFAPDDEDRGNAGGRGKDFGQSHGKDESHGRGRDAADNELE